MAPQVLSAIWHCKKQSWSKTPSLIKRDLKDLLSKSARAEKRAEKRKQRERLQMPTFVAVEQGKMQFNKQQYRLNTPPVLSNAHRVRMTLLLRTKSTESKTQQCALNPYRIASSSTASSTSVTTGSEASSVGFAPSIFTASSPPSSAVANEFALDATETLEKVTNTLTGTSRDENEQPLDVEVRNTISSSTAPPATTAPVHHSPSLSSIFNHSDLSASSLFPSPAVTEDNSLTTINANPITYDAAMSTFETWYKSHPAHTIPEHERWLHRGVVNITRIAISACFTEHPVTGLNFTLEGYRLRTALAAAKQIVAALTADRNDAVRVVELLLSLVDPEWAGSRFPRAYLTRIGFPGTPMSELEREILRFEFGRMVRCGRV